MKSAPLSGFLLCLSLASTAQSYVVKFDHLGTREGLSHLTVRTAMEDHDHHLWIGTDGGLDLYNGFEIREFTSANTPLKSDVVRTIHQLSDGRLLIQTAVEDRFNHSEGLYLMDPGYHLTRLPGFDRGPNDDGLLDPTIMLYRFLYLYFQTVLGRMMPLNSNP
jgi:hypothetical protein